MTDSTPRLDDDLSAYLDNEAAPHVAAMIEADAAAKARLAELQSVRDAVGNTAVTPLDDDVVDRLVATALDSASDQADSSPADGQHPTATIASLGGQRTTRRQPPPWLVAAAVVAFMAIGLGLVWSGTRETPQARFEAVGASINNSGESPSALSSAADSATPPGGVDKGVMPSTTMGAASSTTSGPAGGTAANPLPDDVLIDLGTFPTTDALRLALKVSFPTSPTLTPAASASFDSTTGHRCSDQAKALFTLDTEPSARGAATVAGERVVVFEFAYTTDEGRATTLVVATTPDACQPVLTFQR